MLNKGSWQSDPQPHLPKSYNEYKVLFRFILFFKGFKFCAELLKDKDSSDTCWFIYPYKKEIDNKTIVISDVVKTSPYWQRDLYNAKFRNQNVNNILSTFRESNIFYATDLCGTDFKQVIDFMIKK